MFKQVLRGLLSVMGFTILGRYGDLSFQLLKIKAAKSYLQGVQLARMSVIGLMWMGLVIGLICVGLLLLHAGLFILLPWTVNAKAILGLVLGVAYLVIGAVALHAALSEKTWVAKSGAAEMLRQATCGSETGNDYGR